MPAAVYSQASDICSWELCYPSASAPTILPQCALTVCFCLCPWSFLCQVFEELLLDADWSVNAGSWMWLSCSSFFQQFFHCYCPVGFGRRTDPNGDFIRWVPFLTPPPWCNRWSSQLDGATLTYLLSLIGEHVAEVVRSQGRSVCSFPCRRGSADWRTLNIL